MIIAGVAMACLAIAVDGDTLRCGDERIRLLGIDAPELNGHCRKGRTCASGDPVRSRAVLASAIRDRPLVIIRHGKDRYGRTLAQVEAAGLDVGCGQLSAGVAIYVRRWDKGGKVRKRCGLSNSEG